MDAPDRKKEAMDKSARKAKVLSFSLIASLRRK